MLEPGTTDGLAASDRRNWWVLFGVSLLAYGLLAPFTWAPSVDGTFYLVISRNLALGEGYSFLGQPVRNAPPGWPVLLSWVMQLTTSMKVIGAIPVLLGALSIATWYSSLRRLASPRAAFSVMIVVMLLFHWHRTAYEFLSESLFFFLVSVSTLVALQVGEGRALAWRVPVLLLLAASLVLVRWGGLFVAPVLASAVMTGKPLLRFHRHWVIGLSVCVVILGTFLVIRETIKNAPLPEPQPAVVIGPDGVATPADEAMRSEDVSDSMTLSRVRRAVRSTPSMVISWGKAGYPARLLNSGTWFSCLLFPPSEMARFAGKLSAFNTLWNGVGWLLVAVSLLVVVRAARARNWVWVGVAFYCAALFARWGAPNGRYFAPIAPFVILGLIDGFAILRAWVKKPKIELGVRWFGYAVAAVVLSSNLTFFAINAWVARGPSYFDRCLAGNLRPLVAAGAYLRENSVKGYEIATNDMMESFGHLKANQFTCSSIELLTGEVIGVVPKKVCRDAPNEALIEWARVRNVKYYLYRAPERPWRIWHFRIPWLQEFVTRETPEVNDSTFELYRIEDGKTVPLDISELDTNIDSVPGL